MNRCDHDAMLEGIQVCRHLLHPEDEYVDYIRWYTGIEMGSELLCIECTKEREAGKAIGMWQVCEECLVHITDDLGTPEGVRGAPEMMVRDEPFETTHTTVEIPDAVGPVLDIAPMESVGDSAWIILGDDGVIWRFDACRGEATRLTEVALREQPDGKPWDGKHPKFRLYVSSCTRFAAVVNDFGRFGYVVDLHTGRTTMPLAGGQYHSNTVPFSFAFAQRNGRTIAIHRTDWNRLDISDPESGELLTAREPTSYQRGEMTPEHYLDYFHGALYVSPEGNWIADDGWVWHPAGVPTAWCLKNWLTSNVWESEDGESKRYVCQAFYHWDRPMVWLDEKHIAIGGIGEDDLEMVAGVQIIDVTQPEGRRSARLIKSFAGPSGRFFSDGNVLYASDEESLSRWDVKTGARTGLLPGFKPTVYCRASAEFLALSGKIIERVKL